MTIPKVGETYRYINGRTLYVVSSYDDCEVIFTDGSVVPYPLSHFWTLVPSTPTFKTGDRVKRTLYDLGNDIHAGLPGVVDAVGSVDMLVRGDGWVRSYPINGGYWEHTTTPAPLSDKPMQCKKCGDGYPMAVANQPDGVSMICWSCRNRR